MPSFNRMWMFSTELNKSTQYHTSRELLPIGEALERTDRQTDRQTNANDRDKRRFSRICEKRLITVVSEIRVQFLSVSSATNIYTVPTR